MSSAEHAIFLSDGEDGRQHWECECGRGGSVGEFSRIAVEVAAEEHIPDGESWSYISRPRW